MWICKCGVASEIENKCFTTIPGVLTKVDLSNWTFSWMRHSKGQETGLYIPGGQHVTGSWVGTAVGKIQEYGWELKVQDGILPCITRQILSLWHLQFSSRITKHHQILSMGALLEETGQSSGPKSDVGWALKACAFF